MGDKVDAQSEAHLQHIKNEFHRLVDLKYRIGQEEHGGQLDRKSIDFLLSSAIQEAIDQVVYLITLRDKLSNNCLSTCGWDVEGAGDRMWIHAKNCPNRLGEQKAKG